MTMSRRGFVRSTLAITPMLALDPQLLWKLDTKTDREIAQFVRDLRKAMKQMFGEATQNQAHVGLIGAGLAAATVTTSTEVLAQQLRPAGIYTSGAFNIPASITQLRLFANIGLADKLAVGELCDLELQRSVDGGVSFQDFSGFGWTSYGPDGYHVIDKFGNPIDNPDPSLGYQPEAGASANQFRLVLSIPQPLTLGATVQITTG